MRNIPLLDTISRQSRKYGANNLAYTPYRDYMLDNYRRIFEKLDVSMYLDTTYQFMLDGRGRVDGLTSYEGAIKLFQGLRKIKRDQFIGSEEMNELPVMAGGCDYSLSFDLNWATGWERAKAAHSHPIVNYLYRDVSFQVAQTVDPWMQTTRKYHLGEEMTERWGSIATAAWTWQGTTPTPTTPEQRHWLDKIQLYAARGLRPVFPEQWADGVMSYLKAADGTLFAYEETPYGSRLVERAAKPVVHSARAWKVNRLQTADGGIPGWIGQADDGAWIGLDVNNGGYVVAPTAKPDPRLRIRTLPDDYCLKDVVISDALVTLQVAPVTGSTATAKTVPVGFTSPNPLVRVAAPGQAKLPMKDVTVEVPVNTPLAFILINGAIAPFEYGGAYSLQLPASAGKKDKEEILQRFGDWDQKWTAPLIGAVNPRPGTVYCISFDAAKTGDKDTALTAFLTTGGTHSAGLCTETGGVKLTSATPQRVTLAGVRNTSMAMAWDRTMAYRIYGEGLVTNLSPLEFIRPELAVSDTTPIDLGIVIPNQLSALSPARSLANSQTATATDGVNTYSTVLYGVAHVTAPKDKPYLQTIDDVGAELIGKQAAFFEFVGGGQALKLQNAVGISGLKSGDSVSVAVRFLGAGIPGAYSATVRITTQAGNLGTCSTGKEGEPPAGLYYVDIPVKTVVKAGK